MNMYLLKSVKFIKLQCNFQIPKGCSYSVLSATRPTTYYRLIKTYIFANYFIYNFFAEKINLMFNIHLICRIPKTTTK